MTTTRKLKVGMLGIGVGGAEILPAMSTMPQIELYAGADVNPITRERFKQRFPDAKVYDSVESLCADPELDAVWVSTPNRFHGPHTIYALEHGKHVVVEKPMALSLDEAQRMVEAAEKNNVKLLAGHTRAYTYDVRAMHAVLRSGKLGRLRALHVWAYTDWMLRPRSAEELDPTQGGGVPWRQTPHQVDTIRVLGGGLVRSVRGMTGQWMPERPIPGYYTAYIEFEDGTPCTILHNGYGYFVGAELVPWGESKHIYTLEQRVALRAAMRAGTRSEESEKQEQRIGGADERGALEHNKIKPWIPEDLGMVVASCERGDVRQSKYGLYIYDDEGLHDIDLSGIRTSAIIGRRAELEEFYDAIVNGKPMFHDGRWGLATLEVGLAIIQSARERREIMLQHQVQVPPDYDAGLRVPGYID